MTTPPKILLLGLGNMGAALAGRLVEDGAEVVSPFEGRSEASMERAKLYGIKPAGPDAAKTVDIILSVMPPGQAPAAAEHYAALLKDSPHKPLFIDANALSPEAKQGMAQKLEAAGVAFQDAVIIGYPPSSQDRSKDPVTYTSGHYSDRVKALESYGLTVKELDGGIGAAAALKMCFGGLNKGFNALSAAIMLKTRRMGVEDELCGEMASIMPFLKNRFEIHVEDMFPKAYRWVAEMREIAAFLSDEPESAAVYEALANFFEKRAADYAARESN